MKAALVNPDEPALLLRLRRLREDRAWRERASAQLQRDAAAAQAQRRRAQLQAFDDDLAALALGLMASGNEAFARVAPYASARREDLLDLRERCEYALIDDEEALATAQQALDDAAQRWRAARVRSDAANDLLQTTRRAARGVAENRLEREEPVRRIAGPAIAAATSQNSPPGARP